MPPEEVRAIKAPPLWREFGLLSCFLTLALGAAYLKAQWDFTAGEAEGAVARLALIRDMPMVGFVALNTLGVYAIGLYLARNLAELLHYLDPPPELADLDLQGRVNRILAHPPAMLCGAVWGIAIALAAQALIPPDTPELLRTGLTLFLFCANLMIGFAVWAIGRYWIGFLQALPRVELDIVNLSREPVPAFLRFNSRVVLVAAVVGCLSILGLALSDYKTTPPVILFSVYAFATVGLTYAVPIVPLSNLLLRRKAEALAEIEAQISLHVRAATDPAIDASALPDLGKLRDAHQIVSAVRTLPPGGQISVSATALVTGLSFLPAAIQYVGQLMAPAP